jgi:ketosteroid isomerase-like protein
VAGPGEEMVRRFIDVLNRSESVDAVMEEAEDLMHPEIEWVNPADALESGTRKGLAGMRTALENYFAGAGAAATLELEEVWERGERVLVRGRIHARVRGAEAVSPAGGVVFTIDDGRVLRLEWHRWTDETVDEFERGAPTASDQA